MGERSVAEVLVRHAEETAKAEAKAKGLRAQAARGSKKEKAAANQKAQRLVEDLRYKHEDELEELGVDPDGEEVEDLLSGLMDRLDAAETNATAQKESIPVEESVVVASTDHSEQDAGPPGTSATEDGPTITVTGPRGKKNKKSKAQRKRETAEEARRLRREEADREAAEMAGKTPKELEDKAMVEILSGAGFKIHPIIADGNCLFRSILHQLELLNLPETPADHTLIRKKCAEILRIHPDEYLPFVASDSITTVESFNQYCDTVQNTSEWGGELEVNALSRAYGVEIMVFQMSTAPITFGKGNANGQLRLSYHQHYYHLGAHYNSVVALST